MMVSQTSGTVGRDVVVRRRCIYYVSGFDPQGPARYHALYRAEAARQSALNGLAISVGPRRNSGPMVSTWTVDAIDQGVAVQSTYCFLRWDDIVRTQWPRSRWVQVRQAFSTPWYYARTGAMWRLFKLYRLSFYVLVAPAALMAAIAIGSILGALIAAWLAVKLGPLAWSLWAATTAALLQAGKWAERRMQLAWLTRSYAFTARQARGEVPEMEQRLDAFATLIASSAQDANWDEVLVVGHSSGAQMAVSAVGRACALVGREARLPQLSLLTLGHCMPIASHLPAASRFRDDVRRLANASQWSWVDFTAPADGCTFALVDPTVGCGGVPGARMDRPKLLSARFVTLFSPETYRSIRADKMRYHFQYLMATEKAGSYDYFAATAGAVCLAQRYAEQHSVLTFHRRPGVSAAPT